MDRQGNASPSPGAVGALLVLALVVREEDAGAVDTEDVQVGAELAAVDAEGGGGDEGALYARHDLVEAADDEDALVAAEEDILERRGVEVVGLDEAEGVRHGLVDKD